MESNDKKLVTVLLATAFTMMIAGCFFVQFVINVWTYLANLAGEKDVFLASILLAYFVMFALIGAAAGHWIHAYCECLCKPFKKLGHWIRGLVKK